MGNLPAKITGKYQSYDINTPTYVTPPLTLKRPSTTNSFYNEQANNTLSKSSRPQQQQTFQENNRHTNINGSSRGEKEFNRHHNVDEDDDDQVNDDEDHRKAWREKIYQRNSKNDSFTEEIFNSSQQKLEESIYTENPTIRDSRIIEGSLGEQSPNIKRLTRHHIEDDDDDDEDEDYVENHIERTKKMGVDVMY